MWPIKTKKLGNGWTWREVKTTGRTDFKIFCDKWKKVFTDPFSEVNRRLGFKHYVKERFKRLKFKLKGWKPYNYNWKFDEYDYMVEEKFSNRLKKERPLAGVEFGCKDNLPRYKPVNCFNLNTVEPTKKAIIDTLNQMDEEERKDV